MQYASDNSVLMDLVVANLPIFLAFLQVSPPLPGNVTLPYGAGSSLPTTAGCVRRCGTVKIRIVSLLESVVRQGSLVAWSVMSVMKVNQIMKVSVGEDGDDVGPVDLSSMDQCFT